MNGSTATITTAGTYEISGTLDNGQLVVETEDDENVTLLLAGVNIHNEKRLAHLCGECREGHHHPC